MATPCDPAVMEAAVEIAQAAGTNTLPWFQAHDLAVERKTDGTPVTEADRATERIARELLTSRFPNDGVIGEEMAATPGSGDRTWYLDPIDGTKAFTRGVPLYSTLLAASDREGALLGVIHLPALGETVWAGRGRGCWWDGKPAHVSDRAELAGAYLMTSAVSHWPDGVLERAMDARVGVRTWGDGYGYALVATGRADAMVDPTAAVWDLAPMPVILGEAGGSFTDLGGSPSADGGSGLATNGKIHDALLALFAG